MLGLTSVHLARLLVQAYDDEAVILGVLERYFPAPVASEALRNALRWKRAST
jgi:hypothetical protein